MAEAGDRASNPKLVAGSNDGAGDLKMVAGAGDLKMVARAGDEAVDDLKMVAGADDEADDPCWRELVPACYHAFPVSGTPDARIAPIHNPPPQAAEREVLLADMVGTMSEAAKRVETEVSLKPTRIHRFPHHLIRGIGGAGGCYVVPRVVAIGPYHHGLLHLRQMEEVKQAAALRLSEYHGRSVQEVYENVLSVADDARRCYDASAVAHLSKAQLAYMMFLDGCFLLWFMSYNFEDDRLLTGCAHSSGPSFRKDLFLLENQIPWLVLEALMVFLPEPIDCSVASQAIGTLIFPRYEKKVLPMWIMRLLVKCRSVPEDKKSSTVSGDSQPHQKNGDSQPPHLLGLLRFILIHNMPPQMRRSTQSMQGSGSSLTISAVDMAQKGVKLAVSTAEWFADMSVKKKPFYAELSLSPMLLDDTRACWLANLAALEAAEAIAPVRSNSDGYVVSSYLSLLAMLMDRVEDVHELRRSGVLRSRFCNTQTLAYFKGMAQHLRLGYNYFNTLEDIEDYMHRRTVRIAVHKFLYNNYRIIAALLSIAGVLVGIFGALYSIKIENQRT